ncbi:MAG: quinone-dependent dihydroorotate dehydrogenase [Candidatus Daviesbacteria bacterium]|nr:quinone-dependent dihydroorotate dehydrogenase [Candidatus Daviesbacteria bacterium]
MIKTNFVRFLYQNLLKPVFFKIDPESIHDFMTWVGMLLGKSKITKSITAFFLTYSHPSLEQKILGIKFNNPVGLAAGFDKNARLTQILPSVGFGFTEIGTITGEPCSGNPKPRLWRLKESKSLLVYYGLKNDGCETISNRLEKEKFTIPVITSIGKTNCQETVDREAGIKDYVKAYKRFTDIGHFFDINLSCPNAFGGQPFSDPQSLDQLLEEIDKIATQKPVFLKVSPDLTDQQIDEILSVVSKHKVAGFICTNLTKDFQKAKAKISDKKFPEKGGISGKVVEDLANDLIQKIYLKTKGEYIIIGCGGVFSAEDAYKKIKLGASLVELITGMIFEGPQLISEINQGLVKLLQKDGYKNISEAVGANNP